MNELFEELWKAYPSGGGKKAALRHFNATVKTEKDAENIKTALINYMNSEKVLQGFIKNGSTWFNEWEEWINPKPAMMGRRERKINRL